MIVKIVGRVSKWSLKIGGCSIRVVVSTILTVFVLMALSRTFLFFFFIQFNVPFKIISLIETSQSVGGAKLGKPPDTPASRTWLVSHVDSAGLEPTPGTAVR